MADQPPLENLPPKWRIDEDFFGAKAPLWIGFVEERLKGDCVIRAGLLWERLKRLGLTDLTIKSSFPHFSLVASMESNIIISAKDLIYTLRELGIYENDLEQILDDIVPNPYRFR